jgi:hypothetical protein
MLKRLCWVTLLSIVLTPLIQREALSVPVNFMQNYLIGQTLVEQNPDWWINEPYCYMLTDDGRLVNLERLCDREFNESQSVENRTYSEPQSRPRPIPGTTLPMTSGAGYAEDAR